MARNLALGLQDKGHDVSITGYQTYFKQENYKGIPILPLLDPTEPGNPHIEQFQKNLSKSGAEALIVIDYGFSKWTIFAKQFTPSFLWVPIEGLGVSPIMKDTFSTVGAVSQTYFGQTELQQEGITSNVVYPGWDPKIFKTDFEPHCKWSTILHQQQGDPQLLCRQGCYDCLHPSSDHMYGGLCRHFEEETIILKNRRHEMTIRMSQLPEIREQFGVQYVIGVIANNMDKRKNIEALIKAFSMMKYKKDALLHIHIAINTRGEPISYLAEQFKIADKVIVSYGEYPFSISDRAMNWIYNNFDIYATASRAEGFGIAQHEAMAIGIPQVAPEFQPFIEMIGDSERGLLARVDKLIPAQNDSGTLWCEVDTRSLAEKMDTLLTDKQMWRRLSKNAAEWSKQHTWEHAVDQWDKLLQNLGTPTGMQMKPKMEVAV